LVREARSLLWVAPAVALATAIPGFVLAHFVDVPPAQMTVTLLCGALGVAWLVRAGRADD
jgi:ABC-type Mn2+/Zn2+ transport system permease subunit